MAVKIPLNKMLSAIDCGNMEFYSELDDDMKKAFNAWMIMRYASSVKGGYTEHYLLMVNDLVNHNFSSLNSHPELQWKLISICGVGSNQYHEWIKPGKKKGKNKIQEALAQVFPRFKSDDLEVFESIHSKKELRGVFKDAGYSDKEIKALF